jgi:hypothetical protein
LPKRDATRQMDNIEYEFAAREALSTPSGIKRWLDALTNCANAHYADCEQDAMSFRSIGGMKS